MNELEPRQRRKGWIFHNVVEKAAKVGAAFLASIAVVAVIGFAIKVLSGG